MLSELSKSPEPRSGEQKRSPLVLVADDHPDAREVTQRFLQVEGFRTEEAADGIDAVTKAVVYLPSVVVMDLAMPRLDGWQAIRELKTDPRTAHIRIVALTARVLVRDEEKARSAGCDAFLRKPIDPADLVTTIRGLLP